MSDSTSAPPINSFVFGLARGVATVVALAAFSLISILVIIGKAIVISLASSIGLGVLLGLVLLLSFVGMKKWGVDGGLVVGALDM